MPGNGTRVQLNLASVKTDAKKTIAFVQNTLSNKSSLHDLVVVFLGEQHGNAIDQAVTSAMLANPPIAVQGRTRVIFERLLNEVVGYNAGAAFQDERTEPVNLTREMNFKTRSVFIADMIMDAFAEHDMRVVYMVCGSAHDQDIFRSLDKRCSQRFTYISKPSSTDPDP